MKLYVSLLWVCAAAPFNAARPNRAWAALLGLEDPEVKGVRRIRGAIQELQERRLITVEDRGGRPSRLHMLSDNGDGSPYESPTEAYNALRHADNTPQRLAQHQYFRVPSNIWTDGYISRLTGPGFIMLLILLSEQRGQARPVWLSKSRSADRFGLADSTINAGLRELNTLGLTKVGRQSISDDGRLISQRRYRNIHELLIGGAATPVV